MKIKTKKFIRCGICILLDFIVIAIISGLFYFAISKTPYIAVTYLATTSLFALVVLLFVEQTVKKTALLALVLLLPFVGFGIIVFYFLENIYISFVANKTNTTSALSSAIDDFDKKHSNYSKLAHYVDNRTGYPTLYSDEIQFFDDEEKYSTAVIKDIINAEEYVLLEFYILEHGRLLSELETALFGALKRGVKVKLTADYFGSGNYAKTESGAALKNAGADISVFKSPLLFAGLNFNARTHRKLAVIDGKVGYIGGINFKNEEARPGKDCGFKIFGEPVKQIENMIYRLDGGSKKFDFQNIDLGKGFIQLFSVSGKKTVENVYLELFSSAKSEVLISTPYLSFGEEIASSIKRLLLSGVRVKIVIPKKVSRAVWLINLNYALQLVKWGAEVYFYNTKFLHEKLIIVDGEVALSGSLNFDLRSEEYQIESGVLFIGNPTIKEMITDFNLILANSEKGTESNCRINFWDNLSGRFLMLFGYFI